MGKPVTSNVKRVATTALNTKVNKEAFAKFKDYCAEQGYPMNVLLETFMMQYANGRFELSDEEVMKFKNDGKEVDTLNTTFNKEIYGKFKLTCQRKRHFVKNVIAAFMEKVADKGFVLEYTKVEEINNK